MSGPPDLDGPHWRFALALYGEPGVAEACLALQDRAGVDVNVVLVALYGAAARGLAIGPGEAAELEAAAAPWRERAVAPLRALRRDLKAGVAGVPPAEVERIRSAVKALELEAEQVEQAALAATLDAFAAGAGSPSAVAEALSAVVRLYAGSRQDEALAAACRTIAAAVRPQA